MSTMLLVGGAIYSAANPDATAMAVTDGTVTWVGSDEVGRALHPGVEVTDLDGAFVAPGFVDTHVHATAAGTALLGLDLTGVASLRECLERVTAHAAAEPTGVLWGQGWDDSTWPEQRPPTRAEVDACAPDRAVYLCRVDAHSALASTPLLQRAPGVTRAAGWSAEGPLSQAAHHLVREAAREATGPGHRARAQLALLDHAATQGVVCVHECGGHEIAGLDDFRELVAGGHGVQVRGYWGEAVTTAAEAVEVVERTGAHGLAGDLFVDGSLGSRTAWLREPYSDDPGAGTGAAFLDVDTIAAHLRACTTAGVQGGFHVIGDGGVAAVTEALALVVAELGGPVVASRGHRMEHLEMIDAEQAAWLGSWGVQASVQPVFDALWGGPEGLYAQRLGPARAAGLNPYSTLAAAGVGLALSSDTPVTPLHPWAAVQAAVHHRTPGSGISPRAAFTAATRGAWRAGGVRDGVAGTLAPGSPASYAIWDVDELVVAAPADSVQRWSLDPRSRVPALPRLDPGSILPRCLATVHRGRTIYSA
ncbi:MAG: amidohydrolase [Mycobacteriaceae bacterium]